MHFRHPRLFAAGLGFGLAALMLSAASCAVNEEDTLGSAAERDYEPVAPADFAEMLRARDDISSHPAEHAPLVEAGLVQPVVFHVIYKADGTGKVAVGAIQRQIQQLNLDFAAGEARAKGYAHPTDANIRFTLHALDYVQNDDWHDMCALSNYQEMIKPALALDPARYLNVYLCHATANLGLSWIPYQAYKGMKLKENHWMLGVIVDSGLLPGSTYFSGRWAQGDIMAHEFGHHYGLQHLYEGGCLGEAQSDGIDDTPLQKGNPSESCAAGKGTDSCPTQPGKDDIANYMGIYYDACRSHFTPGQVAFMRATITTYKPTLVKQLPVDCVSAVDTTDASPDLRPCVGAVVKSGTRPPGYPSPTPRPWCRTSASDSSRWGWACCPAADGSPDGENGCRLGTIHID